MILGFSGTRMGPTPAQHDAFRDFVRRFRPARFVHGGARGCDTLAHYVVRAACPDIVIEIHPTEDAGSTVWMPSGNCEIYPKLPPLERNRIIVSRCYGLLAMPQRDAEDWAGSGTWATVRYAREIGCPVYIVRSYGEIIPDKQTFDTWIAPL